MIKKYFVTDNRNKFIEIAEYIPGLEQLKMENLPEIQSLDINEVIKEKLKAAVNNFNNRNSKIIVEDTGLFLEALNDFPGPLIKFLLKSIGNDGIYNLCDKIGNYKAFATSVFGLIDSSTENIEYFPGKINGSIVKPKGNFGFGWDQIFMPEGANKTFAEMESIEKKNEYSMRNIALQKMIKALTI